MNGINRLLLLMALISASNLAGAQGKLQVTVKKINAQRGSVRIGIFNKETDFLKKPFAGKVVKADGEEVTVTFENLPAGEYAISAIHDENDNGELDANVFGIPKEGFAFGNNAMGMFGPPSFEKAKVLVKNNSETQAIELKYF